MSDIVRDPGRWEDFSREAVLNDLSHVVPGRLYNALLTVATGQYGYVTTADAHALCIDPDRLRTMARRGAIEAIAHGLYRIPAVPKTALDKYMEATLWPRGGGILSHETALMLHELCDVDSERVNVTVPASVRVTRAIPAGYRLHHRHLLEVDRTEHAGIPIVTPVRAIRDAMDTGLDSHLIEQAIDTAHRRGLIGRHDG